MTYLKLLIVTILAIIVDCLLAVLASYILHLLGVTYGDPAPYFIFLLGCGLLVLIFYYYKKGAIFNFYATGIVYRPAKSFFFNFWFVLIFDLIIIVFGLIGIVLDISKNFLK